MATKAPRYIAADKTSMDYISRSGSMARTHALPQQESAVRLFRLINQTGAEIKIRVLADGQELFVTRMDAILDDESPGIVHPAQDRYPASELKISMSKTVKLLSVEESLYLKKKRKTTFAVSNSPDKQDTGFQIVVSKDGISVSNDYYPVR